MISNNAAHGEKPLMLKDFLELDDHNSDSSTGTVRYLLDSEIHGGSSLIRSRPKKTFSRIFSVIKNLQLISSPSQTNKTFLSKKIITGSFWKKRAKECDKLRVRRSLYLSSPVLSSSCCSEGDGSSASAKFVMSSSDRFDFSAATGEDTKDSPLQSPKRNMASDDGENKEEEKEQLSPVSVMDFPYQDDADNEGAATSSSSPCFEQSFANIERTKHELMQKIRRFESLADLDHIDLTASFTTAKDHADSEEDDTDSDLIQRLKFDGYPVDPHKKLLLDFFAEGLTLDAEVEELLAAAEDWIRGYGHPDVDDPGKVQIEDMGRNRRWRCFELEEAEVAADVEVEVLGLVVDELVLDVLMLGLIQSSE